MVEILLTRMHSSRMRTGPLVDRIPESASRGCLLRGGGVCSRGVCSQGVWSRGGLLGGVCLLWGVGGSGPRGGSGPGVGGSGPGGVSALGVGGGGVGSYPSMH